MYTFQQKKAISRKIADVASIERYRQLLKALRHPAAGRKMLDRQQLAISLVYELLGYYQEAELCEIVNRTNLPQAQTGTGKHQAGLKKNFRRQSNIPGSVGQTWIIPWSELLTAYFQTVSIFGTAFRRLKKALTARQRPTVGL